MAPGAPPCGPRRSHRGKVLASASGGALVTVLSEVATQVQRARTVTAVLEVAGLALDELGLRLIAARLDNDHLQLEYAPAHDGIAQALERTLENPLKGLRTPLKAVPLAHEAMLTRNPVFLEDLAAGVRSMARLSGNLRGEELDAALHACGVLRGALCPLLVAEQPWGIFLLYSTALLKSDLPALRLFAAQLSGALEVAHTIEALEAKNRSLAAIQAVAQAGAETDLVPRLLSIASKATGSDRAAIYLRDATGKELVLAGIHGAGQALAKKYPRLPLDGSPTGEAVVTFRPLATSARRWPGRSREDLVAEGVEEVALIPLHHKGRLAGALNLGRTTRRPYTSEEIHTASLLAEQMAIQMEAARLHADAERRVRQLSLLLGLARLGSEMREVAPLVDAVVERTVDALGARGAMLYLIAGDRLALLGPSDEVQQAPHELPLDDSTLAARAARSGRTISSEQFGLSPLGLRHGMRHVAAAPLLGKEQVIGAFVVGRVDEPPFAEDELLLLQSCAAHVGLAIEHARLDDDLKRSYNRLEDAQKELVKRERLAALGELAALVAHEVRNPLAVIFNSLSSLRKLPRTSPNVDLLLGIVAEEASRLDRMVGDFLDFARPHDPELQPGSLEEVLEEAVEAAVSALDAHVEVRIEVPAPLPPLLLDARLLRQVFINLVMNAIQTMPRTTPPRGQVRLRATSELRQGQASVRVDVIDNGPGIPPAVEARIFEPFFTTRATGTGLGLAVVKRIVESHRGEIAVQATPGGGATFTVRLPVSGDEERP